MGRDMVVSRYAIPIAILCVDSLSTGPSGFRVSYSLFHFCVIIKINIHYSHI